MTNPPVRVFTGTSQFGYEPTHEDGKPNDGEVKRAAAIIQSEYPDTYEPAALIESLTDANPGGSITFPGGEHWAQEQAANAAAEAARAEANESTVPGLTEKELRHRDKVLSMSYKPSPGFGPDGFPE